MLSVHLRRFITGSILGTIFWIIFFYCPTIIFSITLATILLTILVKEWTLIFKNNSYLFWMLMPVYPILPFILLIYFNHNPEYRMLLYYLLITVFYFDTSAYVTGSLIGYHKITPYLSPHKTIEGCIGGFIGTLVIFYWALWEQNIKLPNSTIIALCVAICFIAFIGDIFESFLKRQAKIKHSGNFLPGHGGFLDRFDAVMMVTLFFFLFRHQLARLLI